MPLTAEDVARLSVAYRLSRVVADITADLRVDARGLRLWLRALTSERDAELLTDGGDTCTPSVVSSRRSSPACSTLGSAGLASAPAAMKSLAEVALSGGGPLQR